MSINKLKFYLLSLIKILLLCKITLVYNQNNDLLASNIKNNISLIENIAIVDIKTIIKKSIIHQNIYEQIKKKAKEYKDSTIETQKKLQKKINQLEKQKNIISKEKFLKESKIINEEAELYQKNIYIKKIKLNKVYNDAIAFCEKKIINLIKEYCEKNKILLVISKDITFYNNNNIDITNIILDKLNNDITKIQLYFEKNKK